MTVVKYLLNDRYVFVILWTTDRKLSGLQWKLLSNQGINTGPVDGHMAQLNPSVHMILSECLLYLLQMLLRKACKVTKYFKHFTLS